MRELIIRKAEKKDIKEVAALDRLCFSMPWSEETIRQEIMENNIALYIVAEIEGKVVGYAGMWLIVDEGHITNVAVHPVFRRKHIGQGIVSVLLAHSEEAGTKRQTLEVRKSNNAAIELYSKFDFLPVGIRKEYYEDNGEDALIMWRGGHEDLTP